MPASWLTGSWSQRGDQVRHLVGRDTAELSPEEVARATVESVAENASDAVVAPLLWGAVAGLPGLLGYRAANTLDAMIGHRSPRYLRFGWAAARLDDLANWVPARLAALAAAAWAPLVGGTAGNAVGVVRRDAGRHPSPNAGVVEAAFAGALDVRLGGRNAYHGSGRRSRHPGQRPTGRSRRHRSGQPPRGGSVDERTGRGGAGSWLATMTILILGGTAEARQLAAALVADGVDVISSLAGRVSSPSLPAGRVRIGGFGGADGLADYLRRAACLRRGGRDPPVRSEDHQERACRRRALPVHRWSGWSDPAGGNIPAPARWTWVTDAAAARAAAESARRPFLTTGRQSLRDFQAWADRDVLVRLVDPPAALVAATLDTSSLSRGPYSYAGERKILDRARHRCDPHQGLGRYSHRRQAGCRRRPRHPGGDHRPPRTSRRSRFSERSPRLWPGVAPSRRLATLPRRADRARDPLTSSSLGD